MHLSGLFSIIFVYLFCFFYWSNVLLNISQNILHITVVSRILEVTRVMIIVVCTASISMWGSWEFHVHHWLVWEILGFTVVFWRSVRSVSHQIPVWKAVVMHVTVCKLLLVLVHFVQLGPHMSISIASAHLTTKDVTTLSRSSGLSVSTNWVWSSQVSLINLSNHLHLIGIIHNKLFRISSVDWSHGRSCAITWPLEHDLTLRWYSWYLVVIFLNRGQI